MSAFRACSATKRSGSSHISILSMPSTRLEVSNSKVSNPLTPSNSILARTAYVKSTDSKTSTSRGKISATSSSAIGGSKYSMDSCSNAFVALISLLRKSTENWM